MRNIVRFDHNHFHGWHVCLTRQGVRYERYFADGGSRSEAKRAAQEWRGRMKRALPPPRKFKRRFVLNTSGVIGVNLSTERTRKGTRVQRYCATWYDADGRYVKRSFSIAKYGKLAARALAIEARSNAVAELLRPGAPFRQH